MKDFHRAGRNLRRAGGGASKDRADLPAQDAGEGHFLALLKKKAPEGENRKEGSLSGQFLSDGRMGRPGGKGEVKLPEELEQFLHGLNRKIDKTRLHFQEGRVYYMPEGMPGLKGIRVLRSGLLMGELKKNRFEPSQALAMNLKKKSTAMYWIFPHRTPALSAI